MNRITFQSKAQVPNCCGKLFFRLHNALTRVCFILALRLDVISTPTAPHRIADEIKLLTKERMCSALSSALVLFIPSLAFKCLDGYFKCAPSLINANRGRKNIKVVIVMNVCMCEWFYTRSLKCIAPSFHFSSTYFFFRGLNTNNQKIRTQTDYLQLIHIVGERKIYDHLAFRSD